MPTHSLLQCMESPGGGARGVSSVPDPASSMSPHSSAPARPAAPSAPSCMFCEQTFTRQDELGPHLLTQHPTSFYEPAVLRVEAEFRIPGEQAQLEASSLPVPGEEVRRCIVCGLMSQDATELESHMRKHKDYFTFACNVCGRRFREPWFLKTHMKMHAKVGSKSRAQSDLQAPATVNGVAQDVAPQPVLTRYKMCMVCGFFFPDHEALVEHSKMHNREPDPGKDEGAPDTQEGFLHHLGLLPQPHGRPQRSSKWIPQLDPFNTYQAWQLATKGKVAVGPNPNKDVSQEASTDNEEGSSDRDECGRDGAPRDVLAREPASQRQQQQQQSAQGGPETRRRSLMQRIKEKERPTSCEDCQRTFRTYHQLVLHSRIHKRERSGDESPTSADRKSRLEQAEEGYEEGFVEAMLSENPGAGTFSPPSVCCSWVNAPPAAGSGYCTERCLAALDAFLRVSQVRTVSVKPKPDQKNATIVESLSVQATTSPFTCGLTQVRFMYIMTLRAVVTSSLFTPTDGFAARLI